MFWQKSTDRFVDRFASKVATIFLHIFGFIHETHLGYIAIEVVTNNMYVVGKNIFETTALEKIHDIIARVRNNLISTLINPTSTLLQCHLPLLARRFRMCQRLELLKKKKLRSANLRSNFSWNYIARKATEIVWRVSALASKMGQIK